MTGSLSLATAPNTPHRRIWLAFFVYAALMALFVQLILLPHIFPAWHAGDGMLAGGDWSWFHHIAVDLAQKIDGQGWTAWELRPQAQAPAGIAAAIYALTTPKPWTVIPINAALHATAGVILLQIIMYFLPNWRLALVTISPLVLYPSAMIWYTQIHKDGYSIAGFLAFTLGWIQMARMESWKSGWWPPVRAILWILVGAGLVWVVRPYSVQIMQALTVVLALGLTFTFLVRTVRQRTSWRQAIVMLILVWAIVVGITPLTKGGLYREFVEGTSGVIESPQTSLSWSTSAWLPTFLEDEFFTLADSRYGYTTGYPDAKSNIDIHIVFHNATDVVAYLPRATQIVFLAPFPTQWFGQGSYPANTMMRRISALEMIGIYITLPFLLYGIWRWRRRIEIWVIITLCTGMMLVYGLVVANVGTLYRMRYGYMMTLVALGVAAGLALWQDVRQKRAPHTFAFRSTD